jgi:hypothetical protein
MALNDILQSPGKNMGGLIDHLYIVPVADVDETALAALAIGADKKTLSASIPLKSLKKFYKVYFTKGLDGKLTYNLVGERDGKSWDVMVDIKSPNHVASNEAVIDELVNTPVVIISRDAEGKLRLTGINLRSDDVLAVDFPMYMETDEASTGGAGTEKKGHTIQWKGELPHTPLFYTGAIDVDSAT